MSDVSEVEVNNVVYTLKDSRGYTKSEVDALLDEVKTAYNNKPSATYYNFDFTKAPAGEYLSTVTVDGTQVYRYPLGSTISIAEGSTVVLTISGGQISVGTCKYEFFVKTSSGTVLVDETKEQEYPTCTLTFTMPSENVVFSYSAEPVEVETSSGYALVDNILSPDGACCYINGSFIFDSEEEVNDGKLYVEVAQAGDTLVKLNEDVDSIMSSGAQIVQVSVDTSAEAITVEDVMDEDLYCSDGGRYRPI